MVTHFLSAFGLMLVFEGLMPFMAPQQWSRLLQRLSLLESNQLRRIGLISMLIGLAVLTLVHNLLT